MARASSYVAFLVLLLIQNAQSRPLESNSSELISDGINEGSHQSPYLELKRVHSSSSECEHMYGFLPCTDTLLGHIFLIVVYEYLLFLGETYVSSGSDMLFKIVGPGGLFGASVFHVLGALPEGIILFVSGMSKSTEIAQEQVMTGVGVVSGSTIFLLTLLWGTCVLVGKRNFPRTSTNGKDIESSVSADPQRKRYLSSLTGSGITIDLETSYTARIMVLSVIPFIIVQLPSIFGRPSWGRIIIMATIVISALLLFSYFLYQVFQPWIPMRRLEYAKNEHLMADFLKHVEKYASGKLLTSQGAPNLPVIKTLFEHMDGDGNNFITPSELQKLIVDIESEKIHPQNNIDDLMEVFDIDGDEKISKEEFLHAFSQWLVTVKHAIGTCSKQEGPQDNVYKQKMIELARKTQVREKLQNEPSKAIGSFPTENGRDSLAILKGLFEIFDLDGDKFISLAELKELIHGTELGKTELSTDEAVEKYMNELDTNHDGKINEEEFLQGFSKRFGTTDDIYQAFWKATDKEIESTGKAISNTSWTCFVSVLWLLLGTTIMSLLAEPLVDVLQNFSNAANIPPFYVSFIVIPLATNSREAVSAIVAASSKKPRTTSLTFSEIYGGVFINNILGLTVLLGIVYGRGLTWNFSAEMLVVIIICVVMGVIASFRRKLPVWTSSLAYFLYPFSLVLVYVLDYVYGWK